MSDHLWRRPELPTGERVEALLAAMTLDEKLAQLGSFWPRSAEERAAADPDDDVAPMAHAFQPKADHFDDAIADGLGHITRAYGSGAIPLAEGMAQVRAMQKALSSTRLGIPAIVHEECLTGFTALGATVFPTPLALAATFDPALVEEMGAAMGSDMRRAGVHQGLSPVLDVVRDYRWGRVEETFGEDPYLVATAGTAYVKGLEKAGIVATLKHFAGYSASRAGRNHAPVSMGRRELEDVILPPFEMAVREGGTRSVMNSYADVDGVPAGASSYLLTEVLRDRWGFTGTVVSDYWTIPFLDMMHRLTPDRATSGAVALRAGIDVELPDTDGYGRLAPLIASGQLEEAFVDRAVRRVLAQKIELGLLDPSWESVPGGVDTLDSPHNRAVARSLADRSIVLLANDGILPLADQPRRVAVIGPVAAEPRAFLGCYSFPNHILAREEGTDNGIPIASLLEALTAAFPTTELVHVRGTDFSDPDISGISAAAAAAQDAEIAVVTVGDLAGLFGRGTSGEGCDVETLTLPGAQADLVEAVLATGTPTVLVVVSGRPYALGAFADRCAAIVQAFMPGAEGGQAIAGVLSGRLDPSGRLPVGVPRNPGTQPATYLAPILGRARSFVSNMDPIQLFPFGHGLTYTSFAYDDLTLDTGRIGPDGTVRISVTVRNTGDRDGTEVVQLYLTDDVAQVVRPVRELAGYLRTDIRAGESRRVVFDLHADRTSFTGIDGHRRIEAGTFTVHVGRSSEDLPLRAAFTIDADRVIDSPRVLSTPASLSRGDDDVHNHPAHAE
ncbi:glycoside hydrolase family 3 N-terminal domain-containing protein [Actinoplanes sp. NBRC 101535]|uniref:beta-glucosidase family protein n=1 Tax=Actinoplanes sp. NBRC 101535 TaxID=3032196 RepID=UPI00249FC9CE|nr:glycoside hydrolase family 3 N-terminal domain-containing protein [Actinoplanes sp. NBRC 101535]GLY06741.1 glycosyl hydrolase [Actinoplanes sp. NBRC 101535]